MIFFKIEKELKDLFFILEKIKESYINEVFSQHKKNNTKNFIFIKDKMFMFNQNFNEVTEEEQKEIIIKEMKNHLVEYDFLFNTYILLIKNKNNFYLGINENNEIIKLVIKNIFSDSIKIINIEEQENFIKNNLTIKFEIYCEMNNFIFNNKDIPNEDERIKNIIYEFLILKNENLSIHEKMELKEKIIKNKITGLNNLYNKIKQQLNLNNKNKKGITHENFI